MSQHTPSAPEGFPVEKLERGREPQAQEELSSEHEINQALTQLSHVRRRLRSAILFFALLNIVLLFSGVFYRHVTVGIFKACEDNGNPKVYHALESRTLRFGPDHVETLPSDVVDGLLSLRPYTNAEGSLLPKVSREVIGVWRRLVSTVSDEVFLGLAAHRGFGPGFIDVTDVEEDEQLVADEVGDLGEPNASAHPELEKMFAMVDATELKNTVGNLSTQFATRFYRSKHARAPAVWIHERMLSFDVKATLVENTFKQPNVVGRIEGDGSSSDVVIIGAHLDSTSWIPTLRAPGADDDASGISVILSALRILRESGWVGKHPIEVHAYAGEEGGLLGSGELSRSYKKEGRKIKGMLQVEMVGWQPDTSTNKGTSSTITVLTDPNPKLSNYTSQIVATYVPTAELRSTACGYGCSDHDTWDAQGYPVACIASYGPRDKNLNPNYHSPRDTYKTLNYARMTDFVRATLAWVVEMSA